MTNKRLFISMLLPKGAGWRGEGIAQTIENLVNNLPPHITPIFIVNSWHVNDLQQGIKRENFEIISSGSPKVQKSILWTSVASRNDGIFVRLWSKLSGRFDGLIRLSDGISYLLNFYINSYKASKKITDQDVLWLPVPTLPRPAIRKRIKVIMSFWDPFGLEYPEFPAESKRAAIKSILEKIEISSLIFTQSEHNKNYLCNVLGVSEKNICILPLGSPDYKKYFAEYASVNKRSYGEVIQAWGTEKIYAPDRKSALQKLSTEILSKTVFHRLAMKLFEDNKFLVLISTQYRPYKGIDLIFDILSRLKKEEGFHGPLIVFTGEIPKNIKEKYPDLYEDIHEIQRISPARHALLNYMADIVIHPSFVEGGEGAFPCFEAESMGVPCLINKGRHTRIWSGAEQHGCVVDFTDETKSLNAIKAILTDEKMRESNRKFIASKRHEWRSISERFSQAIESI